jgi:predicted nucleotidyltransferase
MASTAARPLTHTEIERALRDAGAGDSRILALYLFGSRGRHEETAVSDVDVGVLWREPQTLRDVLLLEDALVRRLGREVDVVDAGRASAFLARRLAG